MGAYPSGARFRPGDLRLKVGVSSHRMYRSVGFGKSTPTKSATYCSLFLIKISGRRFCVEVDSLKIINKYIVSDKVEGRVV